MTKRDVLSVAFKIIGVSGIMYAILSLPQIFISIGGIRHRENFMGINPYWLLMTTLIYPILLVCISYLLIKFSDIFAEKLIAKDAEVPTIGIVQWEKPIFILANKIIGVICLTRGIPSLVRFAVKLSKWRYENIPAYDLGDFLSAIALIILGIYLLSGGKKIIEFAYKEKPESQQE